MHQCRVAGSWSVVGRIQRARRGTQTPTLTSKMAETTEAPPAAETEVQQSNSHAPVDETWDESLLIKVKGKVKRPERPDDTEKNLKIAKLKEEIDKASARIAEIKGILDNKMGRGGGPSPEAQAIRDRKQQLRTQFSELVLQKKRLQTRRDDHQTEKEKALTESRSIRDSIRGPINLQALDEKIAELEFKLTHESLSAAEEKRLREQKERAEKQDRPGALRYAQLQAKIDAEKAAAAEVRTQIQALDQQLDAIKAAQEAEDKKMDAIRARQDEQRSDIPSLQVEKKDLWEVITALRQKQSEIRDDFQSQWDEFKKRERAWRGWAAADRRKRDEQRKKEYEERQAARKARDQGVKPVKYEQEVFMCEQVISYLKKFNAAEDTSKGDEAKELVEAPEPGMKLLKKKDEGSDDFMFTGSAVKKGRGARKAAEKEKVVDRKTQKLQHTMETMKTFMTLGVAVPNTVADVPATLEAVTAKKAEYEELREKAAQQPDEPEQEAAAEEVEEAAAEEEEEKEEAKEGEEKEEASSSKAAPSGASSPTVKRTVTTGTESGVGLDLSVDDAGKVLVKLTV